MAARAVLLVLAALVAGALAAAADRGRLEGRLVRNHLLVDVATLPASTRVVLNGGEYVGFVREDGSFAINNVPSGVHVLEVQCVTHAFDKLRVDFSASEKTKPRVTLVQLGADDATAQELPYPVRMEARAALEYFVKREGWNAMSFLGNPMMIMVAVMFGMAYILPKLTEGMDPEALKEAQQQQAQMLRGVTGGGAGGTDISQRLATMFNDGEGAAAQSSTPKKKSK